MPADIPLDIVRLDLSRNNIKQLRPKEFVNIKDLKLLNLSGNSLESIDTGEPMTQTNPVLKTYAYLIVVQSAGNRCLAQYVTRKESQEKRSLTLKL